jgi:hypothetical protein
MHSEECTTYLVEFKVLILAGIIPYEDNLTFGGGIWHWYSSPLWM